jgi:hypothetical protein
VLSASTPIQARITALGRRRGINTISGNLTKIARLYADEIVLVPTAREAPKRPEGPDAANWLPLEFFDALIRVKYFSIRGRLFFPIGSDARARLKAEHGFSVLERERIERWESGKPAFGFPLFHPLRRRPGGNVGIA